MDKPISTYRKNANYLFKFGPVISIVIFCICAIVPLAVNAYSFDFQIIGGIVGGVSALIVVIVFLLFPKERAPPLSLLFWRAFCDLGIAIRFIATPGFNDLICNETICYIQLSNQSSCWLSSTMLQFFEMSSEAWFFCIGLDLYFSIHYPFSSFKSRVPYYHLFSWTYALAFSIPTLVDQHIFGFWYIDIAINDAVTCWIQIQSPDSSIINYRPWVLLYVPVTVIYSCCLWILIKSYFRLRQGISRTIIHRMRVLIINSINIAMCLLYWFVLGILYGTAYLSWLLNMNSVAPNYLFKLLLYVIAAKGFSALLVWMIVSNIDFEKGFHIEQDSDQSLDFNSALRQEILHYATTGIKKGAKEAKRLQNDSKAIKIKVRVTGDESDDDPKLKELTVWFFLRFLMGRRKEMAMMSNLLEEKSKQNFKPSMPASALLDNWYMETREAGVTIRQSLRASQRLTVVAGTLRTSLPSAFFGSVRDSTGINKSMTGISLGNRGSSALSSGNHVDISSSIASVNPLHGASGNSNNSFPTSDNRRSSGGMGISRFGSTDAYDFEEVYSSYIHRLRYRFLAIIGRVPDITNQVVFTEFEPYHFRRVRLSAGIADEDYIGAFETTIKERLTEGGASGAFFFFSKDELFLAKSCTTEELENLTSNAAAYADYLTSNPGSYISKIFGAYRLRIYSTSLYFFVMNNIFLNKENAVINEKYDIKGSWVSRNATPPRYGQTATCTHCAQKYVITRQKKNPLVRIQSTKGKMIASDTSPIDELSMNSEKGSFPRSSSMALSINSSVADESSTSSTSDTELLNKCPHTVKGFHEPNIVLKDNDLKYKLRLPMESAISLRDQLKKDADFLLSVGVMDYSLLVGVHNTEYMVSGDSKENETSQPKLSLSPFSKSADSTDSTGVYPGLSTPASSTPLSSPLPGSELNKSHRLMVSRVVGPEAYYMGIIDYQQKWNLQKRLERFAKINFKGADAQGLSSIEPDLYRDRFVRHIEDLLDLDESAPKL